VANPKYLITAGCSFSYHPSDEKNTTWPTFLQKHLNVPMLSLGHGGAGNTTISRKVIYNLTQVLKRYQPEDILMAIMWSFPDRHEVIISRKVPSLPYYENKNRGNLSPYGLTSAFDRSHYLLNATNEDELTQMYFKNYHDFIAAQIVTLENILRIQWFLKNSKIKYLMMHVSDTTFDKKLCGHPEVSYLYNLLDHNYFLNTSAINYFENISIHKNIPWVNGHPVAKQQEDFCYNVIIPELKKLGYVD